MSAGIDPTPTPGFLSKDCRYTTTVAQKNPLGGQGWIWVTSRTAPLSAEVVMAA